MRLASFAPALIVATLSACIVVPIPIKVAPTDKTGDPGPGPASATCPRPARADALEARVIALVNDIRAEQKLKPLRRSSRLAAIAQGHACDNAARQSYDHSGSDGSSLQMRAKRGGYAWWAMAENTGLGFADSPERLVAFWKHSPYHRENMLDDRMTEAGVGFADAARQAWVLNLGQPR
ncbi:CAP domain-containing protein [Gemmobacter aquatilis]|uniref:CAP domain-containing protein n=1 Tax=Gemmobacter aquatilis TaxID=933059 RepID=UPI001587144F|nr:CAP domain-containing protein [Gemmobacter aquatilis]